MKSVLALVSVGLLSANLSYASEDEPIGSIPQKLALGFRHHAYSDAPLGSGSSDLSMDYTQVKVPLGKFTVGDHLMLPSVSIEQTNIEVGDAPDVSAVPILYTVKSQFTFVKKLDDQWSRIVQVIPSLHTDGEVFDDAAFSLTGLAIWKYHDSENSGWTMGIGVNRFFREYKPIPILSYQYRPSPKTQIDLGFPMTKFEHRWKSNWTGFTSIKSFSGYWRIDSPLQDNVNVTYTSWAASAGIRYEIKPKLWATLELGQSIGREFDVGADDNAGAEDIGDTTAVMFSVGLRP